MSIFFAVALTSEQQNAYWGNTDASDNLLQRLQALWWSSALNEVPSWRMNGLLVEWHEDINQRHKKRWQQWGVIMFTNTRPVPCATTPNNETKWICMIYESLIFRSDKQDFGIYPEESHPWGWFKSSVKRSVNPYIIFSISRAEMAGGSWKYRADWQMFLFTVPTLNQKCFTDSCGGNCIRYSSSF